MFGPHAKHRPDAHPVRPGVPQRDQTDFPGQHRHGRPEDEAQDLTHVELGGHCARNL